MKTIGKITTVIVMLALIACTVINTLINVKNGSLNELFNKNNTQVEQPAEQTPAE